MRINENINWGIINLVQYQILQSNLKIVWQTVRRSTNEILGVNLAKFHDFPHFQAADKGDTYIIRVIFIVLEGIKIW